MHSSFKGISKSSDDSKLDIGNTAGTSNTSKIGINFLIAPTVCNPKFGYRLTDQIGNGIQSLSPNGFDCPVSRF